MAITKLAQDIKQRNRLDAPFIGAMGTLAFSSLFDRSNMKARTLAPLAAGGAVAGWGVNKLQDRKNKMPITKTGSRLLKTAFIGSVYGFGRGKDDPRKFSGVRNAVRGEIGGQVGGGLGALAGTALGSLSKRPIGALAGGIIGGLTGYGFGAHKMTNKFAPGGNPNANN